MVTSESLIGPQNHLDLESYIGTYQGHTRISRALFIATKCPSLEIDAYRLALSDIKEITNDTTKYLHYAEELNNALKRHNSQPIEIDTEWVKSTQINNKRTMEQLQSELRTYKAGLISESIRVTQTRMGDFYYACGDIPNALKSYHRVREHCASNKHVIEMCFNVIKANITANNFASVRTYIARAETTPDLPNKTITLARLKCCNALFLLSAEEDAKYGTIAKALTEIPVEANGSFSDIISPNDVAIYGGLCALASFDRSQLRSLMVNQGFRNYLELEPQICEIIESFQDSKYSTCFELLDSYKNDLLLDMYLNPHVDILFGHIKEKAMVQYCAPFSVVDMRRMAVTFKVDVDQLEDDLVSLIGDSDRISARIDSYEKILYTVRPEPRNQAFDRSLQTGKEYERSTKALMLHLNLISKELCSGGFESIIN
ncbi:26S proteasome subunit RPN7-domain-containing protein [Phycomyces nitens]|nr:26S proteasome subunit RPN7-domain-containing protein [Phycomyces nitens]